MSNSNELTIDKLLFLEKDFDPYKVKCYGIGIGDTIEKLVELIGKEYIVSVTQSKDGEYVTRVKNFDNPSSGARFKYENGIITGLYILIKDIELTTEIVRGRLGNEDAVKWGGDMFDDEAPWYRDVSDDVYIYSERKIRLKRYYTYDFFETVHIGDFKSYEDD